MEDQDDSGKHALADVTPRTPGKGPSPDSGAPAPPTRRPILDEPEFARFGKAVKVFLWPFMFSWAVAYVGGARDLDWLHFTGLGGVLLCMLALLVWLIS